MKQKATLIAVSSICWAVPALANIDLEFRPPGQTASVGDTVNIGLYAVSDDETDQLLAAAQVIISWDPSYLQLLGNDDTGAVPLLSSGFPSNDPFNLNEVVPPQDGDGLYVAFALLGNPVPATPEGVLLTTFQFLALADTPQTPVDILESGGDPAGETIVFDGTVPNLDVTGTLIGSVVEIILEPLPNPTLLLTADPSSAQLGDPVVVTLSMLNLGSNEAAGFQAFLSFDITRLTFISGSYTPEPFGLPIILPIEADGENIDLAAGIDILGGQTPTSEDAELVHLTFEALVGGCVVSVTFREHKPPTGLTDPVGLPIEPLLLIGLPDLADVDDGDACTDDICDPDTGEVTHIPNYDTESECCDPATGNTTPIDDNDACTDDTCDAETGEVTHTPIDPLTCDDGIECTFDFCDSQVGCVNAPDNSVCDDGEVCTTDICDAELGCVNSSECPTDIDGDFDTDAFDLAVLLGCWGTVTPGICECLDADNNGDIGPFDLAVVLGAWGPCENLPGACCNADGMGGCQIMTGDTCVAAGGDFLGPETDCERCPHPACDAGIGDCCSANGTPGCEDPTCCDAVCQVNPDCCDVEWDNACADQAEALCILCLPPPPNDDCEDHIPIFNGDTPFDTTGATTDGPAHPGDCQFDGQTYRDMWFDYIATCTGDLTVSTCDQADYDTDLVVYDGCDCDDLELLGCNDDAAGCAGFTSELTVPVVADNCYLVRVGGFNPHDFGTGTVTLTCAGG